MTIRSPAGRCPMTQDDQETVSQQQDTVNVRPVLCVQIRQNFDLKSVLPGYVYFIYWMFCSVDHDL